MPEIRFTAYLTTFLVEVVKIGFLGKMIDIERTDFKKKVSKKIGCFSKFGCFSMASDKAIKHPNLLKQPTFFETFFKKPSAQYQSFCLKSSFLLVFVKRTVF